MDDHSQVFDEAEHPVPELFHSSTEVATSKETTTAYKAFLTSWVNSLPLSRYCLYPVNEYVHVLGLAAVPYG